MADAAAIMRAGGLGLAAECVEAAALEGLDVALAATILQKESGGTNRWGHDPGSTGGVYVKGGPVTRDNYLAYRSLMQARKIGRQGVGPCQATSDQYQRTADDLGGCWLPVPNMRSGFRGMNALIRKYGVQQGARRYNGSGPAAERYGADFYAKYQLWQRRLAGAPLVVDGPAPMPPPVREEDDVINQATPVIDGTGYFRAVVKAEVGAGSVFSAAWAFVNSTWGDLNGVKVSALDGRGGVLNRGPYVPDGGVVHNNTEFVVSLPPGTRFVTAEGRLASPGVIPTVSAICKPA